MQQREASSSRIVIISDFQDGDWDSHPLPSVTEFTDAWKHGERGAPPQPVDPAARIDVDGGYIERLPLACLQAGIVDSAEIWTHWRGGVPPTDWKKGSPFLTRRAFRLDGGEAPFSSRDMLGHVEAFGAPSILCVWGLGVSDEILAACRDSFKIYNSIDAPAMRIPHHVAAHFDLVLTGAQWQSDEVENHHPGMLTAVLPIGPEFASPTTFRHLALPKIYDVIYVAAAQAYKRHDILFEALSQLPKTLRALCVCGYGEMIDDLRQQVLHLGINVEFIEPPGVSFEEVNMLMNQSRMGVVCGVNDGAPAILTEYMLADIPVLANSALSCGQQYITPKTGRVASADQFHRGIQEMLADLGEFSPREVVLDHWTWPHSIRKLQKLMKTASPR